VPETGRLRAYRLNSTQPNSTECYTKMMVGGKVVVAVASGGESITFQWIDAWLNGMIFKNPMSSKT